jgi:hypothetical protein
MRGIQFQEKLGAQRPTPVEAHNITLQNRQKENAVTVHHFFFPPAGFPISWLFRFARRLAGSASLSTGRPGADIGDATARRAMRLIYTPPQPDKHGKKRTVTVVPPFVMPGRSKERSDAAQTLASMP